VTPLFRKLNLSSQGTIHVLNAPETFASELNALEGVRVNRSIHTDVDFAIAFAVTQAELDATSDLLAKACRGDAVL
jgi:hypothetical protein